MALFNEPADSLTSRKVNTIVTSVLSNQDTFAVNDGNRADSVLNLLVRSEIRRIRQVAGETGLCSTGA